MTTIGEKTADAVQAVEDLANAATGYAEWSDADTAVTTGQADNSYTENGRVLNHSPSGLYVLMYVGAHDVGGQNDYDRGGIRFCVSTGWDGTNHEPSGDTTRTAQDPFGGGNRVDNAFDNVDSDPNNNLRGTITHDGFGAYHLTGDSNNGGVSTGDAQTQSATYFGCATADTLNIAIWNTVDATNGVSGYCTFEYVDNKFWSDSYDPFALQSAHNYNDSYSSMRAELAGYGFSHISYQRLQKDRQFTVSGFQGSAWGSINPDSGDDTFFFRRPVIYETHNHTAPIAYVEDSICNDDQQGGAHGDIVTVNTVDYRLLKQSGAGGDRTLSVGLKYQ